jgi:hypothetical protein
MTRKRVGAAVAIALGAGLLLFLAVRSPGSPESASVRAAADQTTPEPPPRSDRAVPPPPPAAPTGPVVEAITVEKAEVCSGEDNLVTVRLASGYQHDDNVRILMPGSGGAGPQMPFILALAAGRQQPEMPEVVVFSRDGALATVKVPTVTVKDCAPGPSLSVDVALKPNTSATFALTATVRNPGPTGFNPVLWQWDFGDGADATTRVRTVEHRYEDRPHKRRSSFLVHVRAADADGVELLGRRCIDLHDDALDALRSNKVVGISVDAVLRPVEPVPQEREVVTDPQVKAALLAARNKLGRDQVSLDDLVRLKREGALDNLPAGDGGAHAPPVKE